MIEARAHCLGPVITGDETSSDRMRGKTPFKGRRAFSNNGTHPVKSGENFTSVGSNLVRSRDNAAASRDYYSSQSEGEISDEGEQISVMASNASYPHCPNLIAKREADLLSLLKGSSGTSKRKSHSNVGSARPSKQKKCSQAGPLGSEDDLQIEEEILLEYDKSRTVHNEEGPEILTTLAERVDRYWSKESLNSSSMKIILEEYKEPKNVTKFIVPTLNEEIKEAVHPALLRMGQKLYPCKRTWYMLHLPWHAWQMQSYLQIGKVKCKTPKL